VTSPVAVSEVATWVKSMHMTKSCFKTRKRDFKNGNQRNFYINLHLRDGLGMDSHFVKASRCQSADIIYRM